jgi:hypothetical protein
MKIGFGVLHGNQNNKTKIKLLYWHPQAQIKKLKYGSTMRHLKNGLIFVHLMKFILKQ